MDEKISLTEKWDKTFQLSEKVNYKDVLFGEVWSREGKLSARDRSMITIASLMSQGLFPQLKAHITIGKDHGITRDEVVEIITQLAFYAGWPKAWSAFSIVKEVYGDDNVSGHGGIFGLGQENKAYEKYFIGKSYLNLLSKLTDPWAISNVTFEPGCRNNWHIHHSKQPIGQVLIAVDGEGWYQGEGKEAQCLKPGDVVEIPSGVKHWHGAKKDCWFSHIAFSIPSEGDTNEWLEPVTDEEYNKLK